MTKVTAISGGSTPISSDTYIHIILDETGSMGSSKAATISSFNEFISTQKKQDGKCNVSLTTFSASSYISPSVNAVRDIFVNKDLNSVSDLTNETYKPDGMTNLYDSIGSTIAKVENLGVLNPLIVIITDGHDNMSKEYNQQSIKDIISKKTADGWTFVYLGANQDAWSVGQSLGLSKGQTMTYSTSNMDNMMSTLSSATMSYRSMRSAGVVGSVQSFFDEGDENGK